MSTPQRNIETVKAIYEAFGRGDAPAILEHLAEDVDWEFATHDAGVPWLEHRRGRAGAGAFFQSVAENLELREFMVLGVMADGPWVTGLVRLAATVKATGKTLTEPCEAHIWKFDERGRVIAMRHAADTAHHAATLRP